MTLNIENLSLHSDGRALIEHLSFTVKPGQCWFIYGCNGTGKTTLLKTLAGLLPTQKGAVTLAGKRLSDYTLAELAFHRAYLPQETDDVFGMRVEEQVLCARYARMGGKMWAQADDYQAVHDALVATDIAHLAQKQVHLLSGGERQRVALACMRAQAVPLWLLDEPITALDPLHQGKCMQRLKAHCQAGNGAVVVMHDLNLAWQVATHVLLLNGDGSWQAGAYEHMMCSPLLSTCFKTKVRTIKDGERPVFMVAS